MTSQSSRLIRKIVDASGLSQAELARRTGIPRSVLSVYLSGRRDPGTEALLRLCSAAGMDLDLRPRDTAVDADRAARILEQVLDLAEALPFRPRAEMQFPPLTERLGLVT